MPARNDDARDDDVSTRLERCGPYPEPSCDQNIADAVGAVIRPTTAWQRWVITVEWVDPPGRRRTDRRGRRNCRTGPFRRTPVWFAGSAIRAGLPVLSRADGLGGRGGDVWSDTHARIGVIGTGLDRCGVVFSLRTRAGGVNAGEPQTAAVGGGHPGGRGGVRCRRRCCGGGRGPVEARGGSLCWPANRGSAPEWCIADVY